MQVRGQRLGRPSGIVDAVWCETMRAKLSFSRISYAELRKRLGNQLSESSLKNKLHGRTGLNYGEMKAIAAVLDVAVRETAEMVGLE